MQSPAKTVRYGLHVFQLIFTLYENCEDIFIKSLNSLLSSLVSHFYCLAIY